jgi:hypothetical protein
MTSQSVCSSLPLHVSCNQFQTRSLNLHPTPTMRLHDHPLNMSEFETLKCGIYRPNVGNTCARSCQRKCLCQTARPSIDPNKHSSWKGILYFPCTMTFRNYWKETNRNQRRKLTNNSKYNSQSLVFYCINIMYYNTMYMVLVWLVYYIFY